MDKTFNISVRDRLAKNLSHLDYVCGNTGYMVRFNFDEEWDAYPIKTARFIESSGEHHDVAVIDNQCEFPQIMNTIRVEVGVYAGDLYTTTPAVIGARRSILSTGGDRPAVPEDIAYDQMMEAINQDAVRAENAADEAETAAEEAKKAAEKAVGGGIVVVQITRENGVMKSSHTFQELQDLREKKVLLAMEGARTYTYFGQEGMNLVFANVDYSGGQNNKSLHARRLVISSDDTVAVYSHNNVKAPNPNRLKITGAVSAEYDGSSPVTVNIPAGGEGGGTGLPAGGEPHQMLVTDAEGNAKWEDRIIRPPESNVVEVLPECTITAMEDMDGAALVLEPFAEDIIDGKTYTVYWNGTPYKTTSVFLEEGGEQMWVLGDMGLISGGESTGEPFVIVCMSAEQGAMVGYYAMVMPLDGSTDIVLRIERGSMTYHPLTLDYLPKYMYGIDESKAVVRLETTLTFDSTDELVAITTPFTLAAGMETIVNWNGVEYSCVSKEYEDGAVVVGNLGLANKYPVTNEPFFISTYSDHSAGAYGLVAVESGGLGTVTVSITQKPIRKVPEKFLPEGSVVEPITLTLAADGTFTSDVDFETAYQLDALALSKTLRVYAPSGVNLGSALSSIPAYFSVSNVFKGYMGGGYRALHFEIASFTKLDSNEQARYELWWYVYPHEPVGVWRELPLEYTADGKKLATEAYVQDAVHASPENAGKLLYVTDDGSLQPLALGTGLTIVDGVLTINATTAKAIAGMALAGQVYVGEV